MSDSSPCPTNYPTDYDDVSSLASTHENVLLDVARAIESTPGGRTIALVGSYGSGKTTLMRKLRERFHRRSGPVHVFLFDAWAHRADALRRGFVARFARFLRERGLFTLETEKAIESMMTRKADVTVTRTAPRAPIAAAIFASISLVMPMLAQWLRDRSVLALEPWLFFFGGACIVAAFMALPLRVFSPAAWTVTQGETTRASDLTSREFEAAFVSTVTAALKPHPSAKVVCVLDDLDRLNPDEVDEIVTALRIFLDSRDDIDADLFARIWFVVPFDRAGFLHRFQRGTQKDAVAKLFALRFDLPPSTLMDGSAYFHERFQRAFPRHSDTEASAIYFMVIQTEGMPTPRRVNELLAAIGIHHATRCESISITSIAAYTLIADTLTPESLATVPRPGGTFDEQRWRTECAALFYRADLESAQHMLRRPEIEDALAKGNGHRLVELASAPGFDEVCEHFVRGKATELAATPVQLLNVAGAMGMVVPHERHAQTWLLLVQATRNVQRWPVDVDLIGIVPVLQHASESDDRETIQRTALRSLGNGRQSPNDDSAAADFQQWLGSVRAIIDAVSNYLPPADAYDVISGSPRFRLEVLRAIDQSKLIWPFEAPIVTADSDELQKVAFDMATTDRWSDYQGAIALLMKIGRGWNWRPTLQAAEQMTATASVMNRQQIIGQIIEFCLLLEHVTVRPEVIEMLNAFAKNGNALSYLSRMRRGPGAAAVVAAVITRPMDRIGSQVFASSGDDNLKVASAYLMEIFRHPDREPQFLQQVTRILDMIGAGGGDVAARMQAVAAAIDAQGGLKFLRTHLEQRQKTEGFIE